MVEPNQAFVASLAKLIVEYLPPPITKIYEVYTLSEVSRTKISLGFFDNLDAVADARSYLISQDDENYVLEVDHKMNVKRTFDPTNPYGR